MSSNSQMLMVQERVENDLLLGESHFREFKSALHGPARSRRRQTSLVAKDISETLVAFANADGGTLIVGAEDDGAISGLTYAEDRLQVLQNAPFTHVHDDTPLPGVRSHLISLQENMVLVFDVQKGTQYIHLTSDGRCLQRRDTDTVPVSSEQIRFERHEQLSREYDRQWIDSATTSDLNLELIKRVVERVSPGMSVEKCLQTLGLAEFAAGSLRLRAAALLLFSTEIGKWHPRSEIRFQRIAGSEMLTGADYNVIQDETYTGNVLQLLSEGWEQIRQFLVQRRLAGGTFQFQASYPEDVCREAFVNAVAHRDYSIEGRAIEILVFDDRLEIRNPGRLLSTVKLAELRRGGGVHDSRNTFVSRVLRELGYMQEMGEGIRRINALMNGHELAAPEIDSIDHTFSITLSQRNIFSPVEQRWLDAFAEFQLSREEKLIVMLGRGGNLISPSQIWQALDIVDTEDYRQFLEQLQTKGLLSTQVSKGVIRTTARRQGIGPRDVPRFAIRTPDIVQKDQREIVEAVISSGPFSHVGNTECEAIRDRVSGHNAYRNSTRIRLLLRWLELIAQGGAPTPRLIELWGGDQVEGGESTQPRSEDPGESTASLAPVRDIYVGNLDYEATEQDICKLFEKVGPVLNVALPKDYLTGNNRGYAFVRMSDTAATMRAFTDLNGRFLVGRPLSLGWSFRRAD